MTMGSAATCWSVGGAPTLATGRAALDAETAASRSTVRVGAPTAWARGGQGAGVSVALLDSGVLATHVELLGRLRVGFDAIDGGRDTGDANGHGTHVAGLIAAARDGVGIVGIAPSATIVPVRVFAHDGASDAVLSAGVRWAVSRASILNLSLAANAPIAGIAIRDAIAGGALLVVAAGNRSAPHPDWPARYAREPWANGPGAAGAMIVVGAVDADNRMATFSNRAGDTAPWFLVAPGVDVLSSFASGDHDYARISGTSMAAPAVSGAAALLQSIWPRLSARDAAAILLATARDLGAPGTDATFGRGLLDVEAALRPVGDLTTRGASGRVSLGATGLRLSPATAGLAHASARDGLVVVALDAYGRDYSTGLASRVVAPLPRRVAGAVESIDLRMERRERELPGGARLAWQAGDSFALVGRDAIGEFAFGAGARAHEYFGVEPGLDVGALANPYASLGPRGAMLARGLSWGGLGVRVGVLGGAATESSGTGWSSTDVRTTIVEASARPVESLALTGTWTRSDEQGAWLGAIGTGAFAPGEAVRTDALQIGASWSPDARTTVAATRAWGRTAAHRGSGVLAEVGAARSDAAAIAVVRRDAATRGDALSLSVAQPMRTRSGVAALALQTGLDSDGAAVVETRTLTVVPDGRERIVEIGWRAPLDRASAIGIVAAWRRQPDHDRRAADDRLFAVRYRLEF